VRAENKRTSASTANVKLGDGCSGARKNYADVRSCDYGLPPFPTNKAAANRTRPALPNRFADRRPQRDRDLGAGLPGPFGGAAPKRIAGTVAVLPLECSVASKKNATGCRAMDRGHLSARTAAIRRECDGVVRPRGFAEVRFCWMNARVDNALCAFAPTTHAASGFVKNRPMAAIGARRRSAHRRRGAPRSDVGIPAEKKRTRRRASW